MGANICLMQFPDNLELNGSFKRRNQFDKKNNFYCKNDNTEYTTGNQNQEPNKANKPDYNKLYCTKTKNWNI